MSGATPAPPPIGPPESSEAENSLRLTSHHAIVPPSTGDKENVDEEEGGRAAHAG